MVHYPQLGGVAQLARACEWHSQGQGFNSPHLQRAAQAETDGKGGAGGEYGKGSTGGKGRKALKGRRRHTRDDFVRAGF